MVVEIRVTGLKGVRNLINQLPKNIRTEVAEKGIPRITRLLQGRIKRSFTIRGYGKGPSSTGASLKSITFRKINNGAMIQVNAPWLVLIEQGKTSSHFVSPWTIQQHKLHPGSTMFQEAPTSERYRGDPVWWRYKGPFIKPAVEAFRPRIIPELEKDVARAIAKSGAR